MQEIIEKLHKSVQGMSKEDLQKEWNEAIALNNSIVCGTCIRYGCCKLMLEYNSPICSIYRNNDLNIDCDKKYSFEELELIINIVLNRLLLAKRSKIKELICSNNIADYIKDELENLIK